MRRRAKRDLLTLLGVAIILTGVVAANTYMRLDTLKETYRKARAILEEKHRSQGVKLIDWTDMRQVKGSYRSGAKFPEDLAKLDGLGVNICGFMAPIDQFGNNVSEFMLLPTPITCYFCDAPPMRDVIEIKLRAPSNMVNEPVLIGGQLELHEGEKQPFFYTIKNAKWNEAVEEQEFTPKTISADHMQHLITGFDKLRQGDTQGPLEAAQEVPTLNEDAIAPPPIQPTTGPGGHINPIDLGPLLPPQEPAASEDTETPPAS